MSDFISVTLRKSGKQEFLNTNAIDEADIKDAPTRIELVTGEWLYVLESRQELAAKLGIK